MGESCSGARGFTLIEIMAVVFVVGLIASLVVVNIDRDEDRIAGLEARRFAALLNHIQDESIIRGVPLGVRIDLGDQQYDFKMFDDKWKLIEGDDVLKKRLMPAGVKMDFQQIEGSDEQSGGFDSDAGDQQGKDEDQEATGAPDIIVEPDGQSTQFDAFFKGNRLTFTVKLDDTLRFTATEP